MTIRYDEKGKYFTDVISKDSIRANIQTLTHRIHGNIHVRVGKRIKDEMDQNEKFLAVTNVEVFNLKGQKLYDTDFILINRDHVIWLIPEGESAESGDAQVS